MTVEAVLFYAFAGLAVFGALAMVLFVRNLVAGAMSLAVSMVSLAGIYLLLGSHLIAALQIIAYAGAVLVLFLFVILLLDLRHDDFGPLDPAQVVTKLAGVALALAVGVALASTLVGVLPPAPELTQLPEGFGGFRDVGLQLFTAYVVPVEVAGLLLLAAIVGAVVLAKRSLD